MEQIILDSFAKINLSLDIVNKREDGYHNIETIMQEIDLKDQVLIRESSSRELIIESNSKEMPKDEKNLVYQAWARLKKESGIDRGAYIYIDKKIPLSSGLAGGSSNCAASLKGLNKIWNLGYSQERLEKIGASLGADVPFCLRGGTVLAKGIGEKMEELSSEKGRNILIANPGIPICSGQVYEALYIPREKRATRIDSIVEKIEKAGIDSAYSDFYNIMEDLVFKNYPIIEEIKSTMLDFGAEASLMSGSGSSVFGIFNSEEKMYKCKKDLEKDIDIVLISKTR